MTEVKLKQRMVFIIEGEVFWVFLFRLYGGFVMFFYSQFEVKVVVTGQDTVGWTFSVTAR